MSDDVRVMAPTWRMEPVAGEPDCKRARLKCKQQDEPGLAADAPMPVVDAAAAPAEAVAPTVTAESVTRAPVRPAVSVAGWLE